METKIEVGDTVVIEDVGVEHVVSRIKGDKVFLIYNGMEGPASFDLSDAILVRKHQEAQNG